MVQKNGAIGRRLLRPQFPPTSIPSTTSTSPVSEPINVNVSNLQEVMGMFYELKVSPTPKEMVEKNFKEMSEKEREEFLSKVRKEKKLKKKGEKVDLNATAEEDSDEEE